MIASSDALEGSKGGRGRLDRFVDRTQGNGRGVEALEEGSVVRSATS